MEIFNTIAKGIRVWSFGYNEHGTFDGPKINIEKNIGGLIFDFSNPYFTLSNHLYHVKWDSGQISLHYSKQLFSLGLCENLDEFNKVIKTGKNAKATFGPLGGLRLFEMVVAFRNTNYLISLTKEDSTFWPVINKELVNNAIDVDITVLEKKKSNK